MLRNALGRTKCEVRVLVLGSSIYYVESWLERSAMYFGSVRALYVSCLQLWFYLALEVLLRCLLQKVRQKQKSAAHYNKRRDILRNNRTTMSRSHTWGPKPYVLFSVVLANNFKPKTQIRPPYHPPPTQTHPLAQHCDTHTHTPATAHTTHRDK